MGMDICNECDHPTKNRLCTFVDLGVDLCVVEDDAILVD
jgi:hypothetical protein